MTTQKGAPLTRRDSGMRVLALALVAHVLVMALLYFGPGYRADLSTNPFDFTRGTRILNGGLPYKDYPFEYPPLSTIFYALPRLFAPTAAAYRPMFALQMAVIELLTVVLVWIAARQAKLGPGLPLAAHAVFLWAAGPMITLERFDLAPAALTLLALVLWQRFNGVLSWAYIGIGAGIKLYPVVLLPLFAVEYLRRRDWASLTAGALLAGIALFVPLMPFLVVEPSSLLKLVQYHSARGVQIESLAASPLLIGHLLGAPVRSVFAFGSQEITAGATAWVAGLMLPLAIVVVAWLAVRFGRGEMEAERRLRYAAAAILAFALFNKVLSAQYMVWLLPLLPLVVSRRRAVWAVYFGALLLTQYLYPHGWNQLTALQPIAIGAQVARNGLLLLLWGLLIVERRGTNDWAR